MPSTGRSAHGVTRPIRKWANVTDKIKGSADVFEKTRPCGKESEATPTHKRKSYITIRPYHQISVPIRWNRIRQPSRRFGQTLPAWRGPSPLIIITKCAQNYVFFFKEYGERINCPPPGRRTSTA
jgi:hypothetical protein